MKLSQRNTFWLLLLVACICIFPFLGLADYHTKGEPREAVVSYSMLAQDDWLLPRNNGGEIPYKPPFFHWTVAAFSAVTGGTVNEYTSRFPSAIALVVMTMMTFVFYARRKGTRLGLLAALVTLTAFELHRAGANTRVDMMLTAFTVCALYLLYRWYERKLHGIPWLAILLMSCATLTKGPVGALIPCLAFGVFLLLRGVNFFKAFFYLMGVGLGSFVLPAAWYYAAYLRGGDEFLDLVMEENFGRMTNTMSYDSCVNPWHYNFLTLLGGYVPWVLLVIVSLFTLKYKTIFGGKEGVTGAATGSVSAEMPLWKRWWQRLLKADAVDVFSATCIFVIFLFYCFPQSKRSVYLMPIYPFIAYFLGRYMVYLLKVKSASLKIYSWILSIVALLVTAAFVAVKCGAVPTSIFHGRHAAQNIAMMEAVGQIGGWCWILIAVPVVVALWWIVKGRKSSGDRLLFSSAVLTLALYLALDGAYQPAVLNVKSVRPVAAEIDALAPASSGTIYEFIEEGEMALGDPLHFFQLNFYLGDRIRNFRRERPSEGYLLILDMDAEKYLPQFEAEGYRFTHIYDSSRPVLRHTARLYRFEKAPAPVAN